MTLVVAERCADGVRLVADTQLTDPRSERRTDVFGGRLKLVVLSPNICVGFAGTAEHALTALHDLGTRPDVPVSIDAVVADLMPRSTTAQYLVASLEPAALVTVRDGRVDAVSAPRGWVGDRSAFSAFQGAAASASVDASHGVDVAVGSTLRQAMEQVIAASDQPLVGGSCTCVLPSRQGFMYAPDMHHYGSPLAPSVSVPSGEWTTLPMAHTASAGSYTAAKLVPEPGVGALALYVYELGRAVLWYPARSIEPILLSAPSYAELVRGVADEFGIHLAGVEIR